MTRCCRSGRPELCARLDVSSPLTLLLHRSSPFVTSIGVGQVIRGWDEGGASLLLRQSLRMSADRVSTTVPQLSLGEKAVLTITPDYGYGARGL